MRFLGDMGISPKSVEYLCSQGHDAIHLHRLGLDRLSDSEILQMAVEEDRIILTHDLDFGDLVAASRLQLPSVIIFHLRRMQPDRVNQYLGAVLNRYQQDLNEGVILSITEGQIRVRRLPVAGGP